MAERLLFLTGHLAEARLRRLLTGLGDTPFAWSVRNVGVKVAALMTEPILRRDLRRPLEADRVILPGRVGLDEAALSAEFGVTFVRGPEEIADLPGFLGFGAKPADLSRHDTRIFAEIVDAPTLSLDALAACAAALRGDGADVIDLGCRPGLAFAHLEQAVRRLRAEGHRVSVNSGDPEGVAPWRAGRCRFPAQPDGSDARRGGRDAGGAGADPRAHGDLDSLLRAAALAEARGIASCLIRCLTRSMPASLPSLGRSRNCGRRCRRRSCSMGTGNLTELTDADSSGVTALLLGVCSELAIRNVLVVQVSPHTRRTVAEHDLARRIMFAARENDDLPRGYAGGLLQVHDRRPFADSVADLAEQAQAVRDANWRIAVAPDGIHAFNNRRHETGTDALAFFPALDVAHDGAHAYYLGTELEIASCSSNTRS